MYMAVTHQVKVTVEPTFEPDRSDPEESRYFWRYDIEIANLGDSAVTLIERHWRITDADGRQQDVRGAGVVGEQPKIMPGESFRYASGCPLTTSSGLMVGEYRMVSEDGERFDVAIPAFSLDSPTSSERSISAGRRPCRAGPACSAPQRAAWCGLPRRSPPRFSPSSRFTLSSIRYRR